MPNAEYDYPDYGPGEGPRFRIITEHEETKELIYGDWWPIQFIPQNGSKVIIKYFKGSRVSGVCQVTYKYKKTEYNDNAYQLYAEVYVRNTWALNGHG